MHSETVDLAMRLIEIDSVNPGLSEGAAGEVAIAGYCAAWLEERGFDVSLVGRDSARPSLIARFAGTGGGRDLMLNGHLDTVGVATYLGEGMRPIVRDGKLYGRGAFDMKGGVAAILTGAARAARAGLAGDIIVTLVADEEYASVGTEDVLTECTAHAAIVVEPSGLELTQAHRGFAWFTLEIAGRAAHGSLPEQGIDAIARAGLALRLLDALRERLESREAHPLVGRGTVRVSTIAGGVDAATVAPSCSLTIERRFLPHESPESVEAELRDALSEVLVENPGEATATLETIVSRGGFEVSSSEPIVRIVAAEAARVLGHDAAVRGEPFWTDAGLVAQAGIPCVVFGVDGGGAHADEEWATVESIDRLSTILERTAIEFCGIG